MAGENEAGIVWYEGLGFDIGARVTITGEAERAEAQAAGGCVVGFDASGPRPGENFIRVLVQPDGRGLAIVALPPAALAPESSSELAGLARSVMTGLQQQLSPKGFRSLLEWLAGEQGRALAADPSIRTQRVRAGSLTMPGLVFPELVELAAERLALHA